MSDRADAERCALLLRAVNVGGRNRVPMAELRTLLAQHTDLAEIATYIASGNVIATVPGSISAASAQVRALIAEHFQVDTPVIGRTHTQLAAALRSNPFGDAAQEKMLHIMFLEGAALHGAEAALQERLRPGERIALHGHDLWLDYGDAGVGESKLTKAVLDRALGVAGTARNLLTLRTLVELTAHA